MHTQDYIDLETQYNAHNYHPLDVVIEKAEGVWVTDVDGNTFIDFTGGAILSEHARDIGEAMCVSAIDCEHGHRDTLVLTYRRDGFQDEC